MKARRPNAMTATGLTVAALLLVLPMALFPTAGSAGNASEPVDLAVRGDRLASGHQVFAMQAACAGQAWGDESLGCLAAIAEASGRTGPQVLRIVGRGEPDRQIPNIF